jgi:hypothetical protein
LFRETADFSTASGLVRLLGEGSEIGAAITAATEQD